MGKSTAGHWLASRGIAVVDSDELARQVVSPGQPALAEIKRAFGPRVISPNEQLDREELASIIFSRSEARLALESILHPRIRSLWLNRLAGFRKKGASTAVVLVPLLYEAGLEDDFQEIICVACSKGTQQVRLVARGWSGDQIQKRIAAQWPVERKMERADFVVWTEGSLEVTTEQLGRIFN